MLFLLGHSSRNKKKTHLIPIKPMTLLCFIYKTSFSCSFILSSRLVYLPLLCPYLTSSPVLYSLSHSELLSLPSCHRGKQNTVAMETAHREERQLMRLPMWKQMPIYGHFLSAGREVVSTFYEHGVSFSCVKNYETDGVTDRVRKQRETETKRQ